MGILGYKAFESDLKRKGFQYEVGKTHETDEEIEICRWVSFLPEPHGCVETLPSHGFKSAGEVLKNTWEDADGSSRLGWMLSYRPRIFTIEPFWVFYHK